MKISVYFRETELNEIDRLTFDSIAYFSTLEYALILAAEEKRRAQPIHGDRESLRLVVLTGKLELVFLC